MKIHYFKNHILIIDPRTLIIEFFAENSIRFQEMFHIYIETTLKLNLNSKKNGLLDFVCIPFQHNIQHKRNGLFPFTSIINEK